MSVCSLAPPHPCAPVLPLRDIASWVQLILHSRRSELTTTERRRETRHPFPYPIRLTPLARDATPLTDETTYVVGKQLSSLGVDFYCGRPLACRRAIACFDHGIGQQVRLLMDLSWCRFCRHGWYENGGRFLQVLPLDEPAL